MINLSEFSKHLASFQHESDKVLSGRVDDSDLLQIAERESREIPGFCLLWNEFLVNPRVVKDASARMFRVKHLKKNDLDRVYSRLRNQLEKVLSKISDDGKKYYLWPSCACWESEPTLWIVCDFIDPLQSLEVSRPLEGCLYDVMGTCRDNAGDRFVLDYFCSKVVLVPLIAGKSFRKLAYPYFRGAVDVPAVSDSGGADWRHIPLPIPQEVWSEVGLDRWTSVRLGRIQGLTNVLVSLREILGYFSDLSLDADAIGEEIIQEVIDANQEVLRCRFNKVLDQFEEVSEMLNAEEATEQRQPALNALFDAFDGISVNLLPFDGFENGDSISQDRMVAWGERVNEAMGLSTVCEMLWLSVEFGLCCDLGHLF